MFLGVEEVADQPLKYEYILSILLAFCSVVQIGFAREVILQDHELLVSFDSESGALTRLVSKKTGWVIEPHPEFGISFRMLAPLPDRQDNFVLGQRQHAAKVEKVSDSEIVIKWNNFKSQHVPLGTIESGSRQSRRGVLPIEFTATVRLHDGTLTFGGTIVNNSNLMVQTVSYPYFGDFTPPTNETPMSVRTMRYDNLQSDEIYPKFAKGQGYWGVFYPTKNFASSYSEFCLIQCPEEGLYVEMENPDPPYLLEYTFEQHPGVLSAVTNVVPQTGSVDGKPVHLEFRTCHFVFAHPHTTVNLVPVVIEPYSGDWHAGVDIYKKWRATWYKPAHVPEWAKKVNSWQQLQVNTPVQNYRVPYVDLVKYGRACAENGIDAIQLVGWNKGGQDGGNPSMDTDPGLGMWQQLHDAIEKVQAMGVHIILFDKFPWADLTTKWYKDELYKYETVDPYGILYQGGGDSYITPVQLAGINTHRFAVMDLLDPEYREIATGQFRKALALGADGFLYDEVCVQPPNHAYSFADGHGYRPPGYVYAGAIPLGKQLHAAADSVDRNFLFAGEGPQDWLTQYYPFSYFRINASSTPVERYIDPYLPMMVAANGFDDREMINLCLLDRYIIEYEPYNFKGKLSDFPLTLAYGKKVDALRKKYKSYLWDAKFNDTIGAIVRADGPFRYSVFVTEAGKETVVVVNMDQRREITAKVEMPDHDNLVIATPEHPAAVPSIGVLHIPPRSAAVLMEM